MRLRLTIILLMANLGLFFAIWKLESPKDSSSGFAAESIEFTRLEIDGKNFDKPRILKLENNKWRIVSPFEWGANLFAINRIRNQVEFLDKETSFPLDEITRHGHSLSEYGLDDPIYILRYGNDKKMHTLKIGKNAPVGDRVYMLDEFAKRVIVVDKTFVENFILDMERLRSQAVFDIPRFEVSAFSIRIPHGTSSSNAGFTRIGIRKDAASWKFETPLVAAADPREVDVFLNDLCSLIAKDFNIPSNAKTGFEVSELPTSIAIEGTNKREVLMLGAPTEDGKGLYARLEDKPTVFVVDAEVFKNLKNIQTILRDKNFVLINPNATTGLDISRDGKSVKLRKLKGGVWDVVETSPSGKTITAPADIAVVNTILLKLEKLKARDFVSTGASADSSEYGLADKSTLKIVNIQSEQSESAILIGSAYKYGGANLRYAALEGEPHIYGISEELSNSISADFLQYRSRLLESLPVGAEIKSLKISEISGDVVFEWSAQDGKEKDFDARKKAALQILLGDAKSFVVREYVRAKFSPEGIELSENDREKWVYKLSVDYALASEGESGKSEWVFTRRLAGGMQYGASEKFELVFVLPQSFIDAFAELSMEIKTPAELTNKAPQAPQSPSETSSSAVPNAEQSPSKEN